MRFFVPALFSLTAVGIASAAPLPRQTSPDAGVFMFADVLEQLETKFYADALAKFQESDFTTAGFAVPQIPIEQFTTIHADEAAHSKALQGAIINTFGMQPVTSCQFNFDSALTDVATMAATARVVENLGVGAYLGAAMLMTDPIALTAAASILTVEARHQTMLNVLSGAATAIPQSFDIALAPNEVLAMASPFISGCDLGIPANPTLSLTNTGPVTAGTKLTFKADNLTSTDGMFCQMLLGGATTSITLPLDQCVVPDAVNGPVALWVTRDGNFLPNNPRDRKDAKNLVAGPTMAFIDKTAQMISGLARSGTANGATTTSTITPEQASSIAGAAATASASSAASATATDSSSAASASATGAAAPAAATGPNRATDGQGRNTFTGMSPDGKSKALGWSSVN